MVGIIIASLDFQTSVYGWALQYGFDFLDRPMTYAVRNTIARSNIFLDFPADIWFGLLTTFIYWTAIGMFLAQVFCAVRTVEEKAKRERMWIPRRDAQP